MKITADTRIAELIKENKKSIEAIASLSKVLEKLKNPMLRKLMASRVTLAEAAKMGGIALEDMVRVLQPLGFVFEQMNLNVHSQETAPIWFATLQPADIDRFDVRNMLSSGEDPLKEIMRRFKQVKQGRALCIINRFVPTPLVRLLEKENVQTYTEALSSQEYHTYFYKQASLGITQQTALQKSKVFTESETAFFKNKERYTASQLVEIDVRPLEMPGPMETILSELAQLPTDKALYVQHKRVPIYLLDELDEQGYLIHIYTQGDNDVKMLIAKQ